MILSITSEFIPRPIESGAGATWGDNVSPISTLSHLPEEIAATHDIGITQQPRMDLGLIFEDVQGGSHHCLSAMAFAMLRQLTFAAFERLDEVCLDDHRPSGYAISCADT